jgi:hypothetical protein
MDRKNENLILSERSELDDRNLSAQERSRIARLRFRQKAAEVRVIPRAATEAMEGGAVTWALAALVGGFLIGYSPKVMQSILDNSDSLLKGFTLMRQ